MHSIAGHISLITKKGVAATNLVVVASGVLDEDCDQPDHLLQGDQFAGLGDRHHRNDVVVVVFVVVGKNINVLKNQPRTSTLQSSTTSTSSI